MSTTYLNPSPPIRLLFRRRGCWDGQNQHHARPPSNHIIPSTSRDSLWKPVELYPKVLSELGAGAVFEIAGVSGTYAEAASKMSTPMGALTASQRTSLSRPCKSAPSPGCEQRLARQFTTRALPSTSASTLRRSLASTTRKTLRRTTRPPAKMGKRALTGTRSRPRLIMRLHSLPKSALFAQLACARVARGWRCSTQSASLYVVYQHACRVLRQTNAQLRSWPPRCN